MMMDNALEDDPKTLRSYCQQLLDIIENYDITSTIADEDKDLISHISKAVDPAHED